MTRVALVVLDTLRKDAFDRHFDWLPGIRYPNTWSPSHGTVQVHGSLFTGRYASEHGVTSKTPILDVSKPTLAERLSDMDISTRGHSSNPYVSPAFGFNRGFSSFDGNHRVRRMFESVYDWSELLDTDLPQHRKYLQGLLGCLRSDDPVESVRQGLLLKAEGSGWWEPTDKGGKRTVEWAKSQTYKEDEFVFINLMEAHSPYLQIPPEFTEGIPNEAVPRNPNIEQVFESPNSDPVRAAYEASVEYLSDIYRKLFFELIKDMDYVITIADHGEMLGEDGLWGHDHGINPPLVDVPLVVSDGSQEKESDDRLVSSLDVYQTILDIFGSSDEDVEAFSLFSSENREVCLTECLGLPTGLLERFSGKYPLESYDATFRGIAIPTDYGYKTRSGWRQLNGEKGLQEQLDSQVESLSRQNIGEETKRATKTASERLRIRIDPDQIPGFRCYWIQQNKRRV
ncbi:sulfatase-like hydrolase/transferase [Halorubrum sp. HHNYT27]|uniref:sulfatase-like hydrolase/transferase n=1 Tax=Halorubrum sp. HHNYT27 TaxID=3402275 RepID=UPI003EBDE57A